MLMKGAGFDVIDLGVDVPAKSVIETILEKKVDIIALSALLTTTMPAMRSIIEMIAESGLRDRVKVIVGGAPVTSEFAKEIGADGFSENAPGAVIKAKELLQLS